MTDQTAADASAADEPVLAEVDPIDAHNAVVEPEAADDAGAETVEGAEGNDTAPKPKQTVQERIDELTRDKHAERRAREALEREVTELKAKVTPAPKPASVEEAEPDPTDPKYTFGETDQAYISDLVDFRVRQGLSRHAQQTEARTQAQTIEQAFEGRKAEFVKSKPDYNEVVTREWASTPLMYDAIRDSADGPAIAYHLAQNPAEAQRIANLPPLAQVRELGKIEARITPAKTATPAKTVSDAPEPAPQLRGGGGRFATPPDTTDFAAFERLADKE